MILRSYQEAALEAEACHRAEHPDENRLAIVLPTGTGKGTIIAERAVRFIEDPMSSGLRCGICGRWIIRGMGRWWQ